jgi:uncharacterized membrane protein YwzB
MQISGCLANSVTHMVVHVLMIDVTFWWENSFLKYVLRAE